MKTKIHVLLLCLLVINITAQEVSLIKDISTHVLYENSNPFFLTTIDDKIYFSATNQIGGPQLWISDGTTNGTILLKEYTSGPKRFVKYNDKVYFTANSNQLWETNGTEEGTILIKSIEGGNFGIENKMIVFNNLLFFAANDIINGEELWVSDGTEEGTRIFKDINTTASNVSNPIVESKSSNPTDFTLYNNKLYFSADNETNGIELWESDGTTEGTRLAFDHRVGTGDFIPRNLIAFNNKLFFSAYNEDFGAELWMSDGTLNGTELVKNINPFDEGSSPGYSKTKRNSMVVFNDKLYFTAEIDNATDRANNTGIELWVTDGTTDGTIFIKDILEGSVDSDIEYLTVLNDKIYFSAITGFDNGRNLRYLWESDGTTEGTIEVKDNNNNSIYYPQYITVLNDKLYFSMYDENVGTELFSFNPSNSNSNTDTETYIPDTNFEQALIDLGYDNDLDHYVTTATIETIEEIRLTGKEISDLTGIQNFTALKTLYCNNNSINNLDISNNLNLEELHCSYNNLTSLNIEVNTELIDISCGNNNISNIDISKNTKLKFFSINDANLTNLDVTKNTLLELLTITSNQISNIDLSQNSVLNEINFSRNNFTYLSVSSNPELVKIAADYNNISTLNLSNNNQLLLLYLRNNTLNSLDLSNNNLLTNLEVNNNLLTNLDISNNQALTIFSATNNSLNCIKVWDVDFANANWSNNIDSTTIFGTDCNLVYISDEKFEQALIDLQLDDKIDSYVLKKNIQNITELTITGKEITDLTGIESFESLEKIEFSFNELTFLDLSQNLNLKEVTGQFNSISYAQFAYPNTIETIDLFSNQLYNIDLFDFNGLKELILNNNNIQSIDVSMVPTLENLALSGNSLTEINIDSNVNLKTLGLSYTGISSLNINNNINLEVLNCDRNNLTKLDVSKNTKLKQLNARANQINTVDLSKNRLLEELNCSSNNLSTLNLKNNIRLTSFEAIGNDLTCINVWDVDFANTNWSGNIDADASFGTSCYTIIPDEKFEEALIESGFDTVKDGYVVTSIIETVTSLNLQTKEITDLTGIQDFTALTYLHLKGNNLESIDISSNTLLTYLSVSNNFLLDRLDISNNTSLTSLEAFNVNLTCIKVWDTTYANNNWSDKIDSDVTFNIDCNNVWTIDTDERTEIVLNNVPGLDKNKDGKITINEAEEFTGELDLRNKKLLDIKGLQAFSKITKLNLSGNNLKDLSALTGKKITLISKTTGKKKEVETKTLVLETLILSNNDFETLNLEELSGLKIIDVSNNPNLGTISLKNGNNANITSFNSLNSTALSCIIVDDKNANYLSNWTKELSSKYVASKADCRSSVLSIENNILKESVKLYPNPVSNFLNVETSIQLDSIEIYNSVGKRIIKTTKSKIDLSNYTRGVYLIKIIAENKVVMKKIIKN